MELATSLQEALLQAKSATTNLERVLAEYSTAVEAQTSRNALLETQLIAVSNELQAKADRTVTLETLLRRVRAALDENHRGQELDLPLTQAASSDDVEQEDSVLMEESLAEESLHDFDVITYAPGAKPVAQHNQAKPRLALLKNRMQNRPKTSAVAAKTDLGNGGSYNIVNKPGVKNNGSQSARKQANEIDTRKLSSLAQRVKSPRKSPAMKTNRANTTLRSDFERPKPVPFALNTVQQQEPQQANRTPRFSRKAWVAVQSGDNTGATVTPSSTSHTSSVQQSGYTRPVVLTTADETKAAARAALKKELGPLSKINSPSRRTPIASTLPDTTLQVTDSTNAFSPSKNLTRTPPNTASTPDDNSERGGVTSEGKYESLPSKTTGASTTPKKPQVDALSVPPKAQPSVHSPVKTATKQEKMNQKKNKTNRTGRLMDSFFVVGYNRKHIQKNLETALKARDNATPSSKKNKKTKKNTTTAPLEWVEEPDILVKFPSDAKLQRADVGVFSFPSKVHVKELTMTDSNTALHEILYGQKKYRRNEGCHVFMIKTADEAMLSKSVQSFEFGGDVLYGVCVTYLELQVVKDKKGHSYQLVAPVSFVLMTKYPFFQLHFDFLHALLSVQQTERLKRLSQQASTAITDTKFQVGPHQIRDCIELIQKYYASGVPQRGQKITIAMPSSLNTPIVFKRPAGEGADINLLLANFACVLAWSRLSASDLVVLLNCALKEYKILVVSENSALLSACVLSFVPLLSPLAWTGVLLPILPTSLLPFLEAPVPIMAGVQALPEHWNTPQKLPERTLVWFPSLSNQPDQPEQKQSLMSKLFPVNKDGKRQKLWEKGGDMADVMLGIPQRASLLTSLQPLLTTLRSSVDAMPDTHSVYYPTQAQRDLVQQILDTVQSHLRPLIRSALKTDVNKARAKQQIDKLNVQRDDKQAFINHLARTQMLDWFKSTHNLH